MSQIARSKKEIYKEGYLHKQIGTEWEKRYFILEKKYLAYYKNAMETEKPLGKLNVSNIIRAENVSHTSHGYLFSIVTTRNISSCLSGFSANDTKDWIQKINKAVASSDEVSKDIDKLFSTPRGGMAIDSPTIYKEGYIHKKCPGGIKSFRKWQKRYFKVGTRAITYYTTHTKAQPLGSIMLNEIVQVKYTPEKRTGFRFDIVMSNFRVYCLDTSSIKEAKDWVNKIVVAKNNASKIDSIEKKGHSILDDYDMGFVSKIGRQFFEAKYGERRLIRPTIRSHQGISSPTDKDRFNQKSRPGPISQDQEGIKRSIMKRYYHDHNILLFILENILAPDNNLFSYDLRMDGDPSESESKKSENLDVFALPDAPRRKVKRSGQEGESIQRILKLVQTNEFLFRLRDMSFWEIHNRIDVAERRQAHGYAVRILWVLSRRNKKRTTAHDFKRDLKIYAGGPNFNYQIEKTLLTMLLLTPLEITTKLKTIETISFYMDVKMPSIWPALFSCLPGSDMEVRHDTLKEITTLLLNNVKNCISLTEQGTTEKPWETMIFYLFCDIPKDYLKDNTANKVFKFSINILVLIHTQFFLHKDDFQQRLIQTLVRLQKFGGPFSDSSKIASFFLQYLTNSIARAKNEYSLEQKDCTAWKNFQPFLDVVKRFLFQSFYWQTNKDPNFSTRQNLEEEKIISKSATLMSIQIQNHHKSRPNDQFVLYHRRGNKSRRLDDEEMTVTYYGVHWDPRGDGPPSDVLLITAIIELFTKLGLHNFDAKIQQNLLKEEKDFAQEAKKQYHFWRDARDFIILVKRDDIKVRSLFSYRKFSHYVRSFLDANQSSRKAIISEIFNSLSGSAVMSKSKTTPLLPTKKLTSKKTSSSFRKRVPSAADLMTPQLAKKNLRGNFMNLRIANEIQNSDASRSAPTTPKHSRTISAPLTSVSFNMERHSSRGFNLNDGQGSVSQTFPSLPIFSDIPTDPPTPTSPPPPIPTSSSPKFFHPPPPSPPSPPPIPPESPPLSSTKKISPTSKHGKSQGVTKSAKTKKCRKPPPPRGPPPILTDKPDIALEISLFGDSISGLPSISDKPTKPHRN